MTNEKINALVEFLGVDQEEISISSYNDNLFEYGNQEYLVLTDKEADQEAAEYIRESVWAFNPDFIISHSSVLDYDKPSEQIIKAIQDQCENGNNAMIKLIDDMKDFIQNAIDCDGRGHFISHYDGEENEEGKFYIYRIN